MPLFAWSSQARGFFTDRAEPGQVTDKSLLRCWCSEDNYRRRERAYTLAAMRGVHPINIALAYVLAQPFPTFPLIGPRIIEETVSSLPGLDVAGACAVGEEIRRAIGEHPFERENIPLRPGISIGVAAFPQNANDAETLFQRADEALYRAKRAGKNQVSV